MKTSSPNPHGSSMQAFYHVCPTLLLLVLLCSCATQQRAGIVLPAHLEADGTVPVESGNAAVLLSPDPPLLTIQVPQGSAAESRKERAGRWARECIIPPGPGLPETDALYSPVGLALAPFAAGLGAFTTREAQTNSDEISKLYSDLTESLNKSQAKFRQLFFNAIWGDSRRPAILLNNWDELAECPAKVTTVLEAKVDELKLEPVEPRSSSWRLAIRGRLMVFDALDRHLVHIMPVEYHSSAAPFGDWTSSFDFLRVAETGYRRMAAHLGTNISATISSAPLLTGVYHRKSFKTDLPQETRLARVGYIPGQRARFLNVGLPTGELPSVGVYAAPGNMPLALQRPLTKEDAVSAAIADTESMLDGLQDSGNMLVQLAACAVGTPVSLWRQAAGFCRGVDDKHFREADKSMRAAAYPDTIRPALALELALQLAPRTSQTVVVLNEPPQFDPTHSDLVNRDTIIPVGLGPKQQEPNCFIEVRVRSARLSGPTEVNPSLALSVNAEATVIRVSDGREIYRCPVDYRGESKKFIAWAANDAKLFRSELNRCQKEITRAIADQLVHEKLVAPSLSAASFLAGN